MTNSHSSSELSRLLEAHLQSWGLKWFQDETTYYQWQKTVLSASALSSFHQLAQDRQNQIDPTADIRFYDLAATSDILPVLYSQRYDFFRAVGVPLAKKISSSKHVLDFGCGVGILTTFWATLFSDIEFIGIDRSSQSIEVATYQANERQLKNIRFERCQIPGDVISGEYDCVVSTQVLFQAESHPGLGSADWVTYSRTEDLSLQRMIENQTGIGERVDALCQLLSHNGKMLLCEKARHLGRRVLLQRALARRGFRNSCEPLMVAYDSFGEHIEDGPLYEIQRDDPDQFIPWNEEPEWREGESLYSCSGEMAKQLHASFAGHPATRSHTLQQNERVDGYSLILGTWANAMAYGYIATDNGFYGMVVGSMQDESVLTQILESFAKESWLQSQEAIQQIWGTIENSEGPKPIPCYENHTLAAQIVWESLPDRSIQEEETFREPDGRAMHIELGSTGPLTYVYWANTYDQRQLVMSLSFANDWLQDYYQESLAEMRSSSNH